jgi:ABC-type antimicrobial peptide transport system permease subunit
MALGARPGDVVRSVTGGAAIVVLLGSIVGAVAGVVAGRLMEPLLYEVKPTGLFPLAAPILLLGAVTLLASLPASLRAARIDPSVSLRSD